MCYKFKFFPVPTGYILGILTFFCKKSTLKNVDKVGLSTKNPIISNHCTPFTHFMEKNLCGNDPKSFLFDSFYIGVMITYYKYKIQKSHVRFSNINNYLK